MAHYITKEQSFMVIKSNDLIRRTRQELNTMDQKVLLFMISKVKPDDKPNKLYTISLLEFCKAVGMDAHHGNVHEEIKRKVKRLADRSSWLKVDKKTEVLFRWLSRVAIRESIIYYKFDETVTPHLMELKRDYTQFGLNNVLPMKSKYAIRLYEFLKSYQSMTRKVEMDLEELKRTLDGEAYKRFPDFRVRVLEPALEDINAVSDIKVRIEYGKTGRKVTMVHFILEPLTIDEHFDRLHTQADILQST